MTHLKWLLPVFLLLLLFTISVSGEVVWFDGSRDAAAPPGKLLSDNSGFWGKCILTGVEYAFESPAEAPRDRYRGTERFGRRLLDGYVYGDWYCPVGENPGRPLVVVFDFKRPCRFSEVDAFCSRNPKVSLKIETRGSAEEPWRTLYERALKDAPAATFSRVALTARPAGRYLRLSIGSDYITWVDEIMVWGDAVVSPKYPEAIAPVFPPTPLPNGMLASLPGMPATAFSRGRFDGWRRQIGYLADRPALWSILHTTPEAFAIESPVLPDRDAVCRQLAVTVARNETERIALALTNTSPVRAMPLELVISPVRKEGAPTRAAGIRLSLLAGGVLASGKSVVRVLPFFTAGNLLGRAFMRRYLANGDAIAGFPNVLLPPGGTVPLWLSVETDGAQPGRYVAEVGYRDGAPVRVSVDVLPVTLPVPELWVSSYGNATGQFPFESRERIEADVRASRALGVTVWHGSLPEPGSRGEIARRLGKTIFHAMALPDKYVNLGYNGSLKPEALTIEDEQAIADHVHALVKKMQGMGLAYDDWFAELWDEPGRGNAAIFGALARLVKKADSHVRLYCNPCFWEEPGGFAPQERIIDSLQSFYNDRIDISVPHQYLVDPNNAATRELWNHPRAVRAFYIHPPRGREMSWKAFELGYNGWAYFCYYWPQGDPWNVATWSQLDMSYQMVFPGPEGPVITPIYEAMREGWEDYRLLTLLKEQGKTGAVAALLQGWHDKVPFARLRLEALRAAAKH